MNKTNIEWVRNPDGTQGYTWNPITGCLNGCEYCYARQLANTRLKHVYLEGWPCEYAHIDAESDPFYPRFWPEKLRPFGRKPKGIFVCSMGDLFGKGFPSGWTRNVLSFINANPQHRFYLLTKQPQNIMHFLPLPANCWVGITLTHEGQYGEGVSEMMERVEAPVKFISFEPLLGRIPGALPTWCNWVIIGAQTKPMIYPKIEWIREIADAADTAGIPVFFKDSIYWAVEHSGGRREMPEEVK